VKPSVHHDIDRALAEIVALDESVIIHRIETCLAQHASSFLDLFLALDFLNPDI